ncbi:hypothetical protein BGZ58_001109 [Dissophora ornata]|nr:hypothetical protein BGZ58_001109 [Dissophora ornata]
MQDLDPASLLFIPHHEYAPLHVDPALFESVGEGVAANTFTIPNLGLSPPPTSSSSTDPASLQQRLKSLAEQLDPTGQSDDKTPSRKRKGMSTTEEWDTAWEQGLDQRVQRVDGRNIFDSFLDGGRSYTRLLIGQDMSLLPFNSNVSSQESLPAVVQEVDEKEEIGKRSQMDTYATWKQYPVSGSRSHLTGSSTSTERTADLTFELPPLAKRPRDILDNCCLLDGSAAVKSSSGSDWDDEGRSVKIPKAELKITKNDGQRSSRDTWRDAGKPLQQDTAIQGHGQVGAGSMARPDKVQLTWEMNTRTGPKAQPEIPIISPYVTEAGTLMFEAVYQKHLDYAFKFRPTPAVIPHDFLVDNVTRYNEYWYPHEETSQRGGNLYPSTSCSFLLLAGTPSSIFTYNTENRKFEMDSEHVRIEGYSTASISK